MELKDKVVVVTGGANGIGRGLCERFARENVRGVVISDIDRAGAAQVSASIGGLCESFDFAADVSSEAEVRNMVAAATERFGRIDLFCSNAGIATIGNEDEPKRVWQRTREVNLMAHVYAARHVLPQMLERGEGYILATASAAGLLTQIGSAPYAVTKHAAVAYAEWLSVTYHERGLRVSCLCPQGVETAMTAGAHPVAAFLRENLISVETVADAVIEGLRDERFLILPHPEVLDYFKHKANDNERWLKALRRLRGEVLG